MRPASGSRTTHVPGCSSPACLGRFAGSRPRRRAVAGPQPAARPAAAASSGAVAGRPWPARRWPTSPTTSGARRGSWLDRCDALPAGAAARRPDAGQHPRPRTATTRSPSTGRTWARARSGAISATSSLSRARSSSRCSRPISIGAPRPAWPPASEVDLGARVMAVYTALTAARLGPGPGRRRRGRAGRQVPPPRVAPYLRAHAAPGRRRSRRCSADRRPRSELRRRRTCRRPPACPPRSRCVNQRIRCSDEPWVQPSGLTRPAGLLLDPVVTDRLGRVERLGDVVLGRARDQDCPVVLAGVRARSTCRRSSRPAAPGVRRRSPGPAGCGPGPSCPCRFWMWWPYSWAEHVGLDEVAALAAQLPLEHVGEERGVEVDRLVGRAVERARPARLPRRTRCATPPEKVTISAGCELGAGLLGQRRRPSTARARVHHGDLRAQSASSLASAPVLQLA